MPENKPDHKPQPFSAAPQPSAAPFAPRIDAAPVVTFYTVLHGAVGAHGQGSVISSTDLAGADVARLLRLGAIVETAAPVAATLPAADDDH